MECMKFGTITSFLKNGRQVNIGEFGLHLQCAWRITDESVILTADLDMYSQPDEFAAYDADFNWDKENGNLRDIRLSNLLKARTFIVKDVKADSWGGFEISFENNVKLTVFPNLSDKSEYNELWRLLNNRDESKPHFVVNATGIEEA